MTNHEPYATTAEHWALMNEVLSYKVVEREMDTSNITDVLDLIREHWFLLSDSAALQTYVNSRKLLALQEQRAAEDAARSAVDQEITDLEAELGT